MISKCSKEINSNFQCGDCANIFSIKDELITHIKASHRQGDIYSCENCDKYFNNKNKMTSHVRSHSNHKQSYSENGGINCEESNIKRIIETVSKDHQENHSAEGRECQSCKTNEREERLLRDFIEDKEDKIKGSMHHT